ncbi:hypothetical protein F7P69_05575 [Cellulosimicrobium funkei]|nr:hypothetical protein [Cellulosimicrobium funkei]
MRPFEHQVLFSPGLVTRSYGWFKPGTHHGVIAPGDWDQQHHPFSTNPLALAALRHWRDGVDWEATGVIDHQLKRIQDFGPAWADRMTARDDILRRYERLDQLYEQVRRTGRLPRRANAEDGIYIHLDRHGEAVFGHRGVHRFVMTHLLQIPLVTAQLGAVHPDAPQAARARTRLDAGYRLRVRAAPPGPAPRRNRLLGRLERRLGHSSAA